MALILVLLCEGLLIVGAVYLIFSWLTQTPYYPSSVRELDRLIESGDIPMPADDKKGISFVDIGAGDGRFVVWAAKNGFHKSEGVEYNPFLFLLGNLKLILRGLGRRAKVYKGDFKKHKYDKYNLAYMYIFSEHMEKIQDKLFSEMPKGSVIITNTFTLKNKEPIKQVGKFYVYKVN